MTADPSLVQAAERFLNAWLISKNDKEALAVVSSDAYACVNLDPDPGEAPRASASEQLARLKAGLERVSRTTGSIRQLDGVIESVDPADSRPRVVEHSRSRIFGLIGVPDWMGPTLSCSVRLIRGDTGYTEEGADQGYGRYFVLAIRFLNATGKGAVRALAWARDDQGWRIYSFKIIEP